MCIPCSLSDLALTVPRKGEKRKQKGCQYSTLFMAEVASEGRVVPGTQQVYGKLVPQRSNTLEFQLKWQSFTKAAHGHASVGSVGAIEHT